MKKNKDVMAKAFAPQIACVTQFMAAYMENHDHVGR